MTHWLKKYSKIAIVLAIFIMIGSCSSSPSKESIQLLDTIKTLKGSNYSNFPKVIGLYNNITDSLNSIDSNLKVILDDYLIKEVGTSNDTLELALRVVSNSPKKMGIWLGKDIVNITFHTSDLSVSQRSSLLLNRLNIVRFLYKKSGEESSAKEMETNLDKYIDSLDLKSKSTLFVLMSSPEELGEALSKDRDEDLIKAIQEKYGKDINMLTRFNQVVELDSETNVSNNRESKSHSK